MTRRRLSPRRAGALSVLLLWAAGCGEPPPSYRVVSLGEARSLVDQPDIALIDAIGAQAQQPQPLGRGLRWRLERGELTPPQDLPEGAVLVVASDERTAHRSAAALARHRFHPVYVYIPRSAEDRSSLQAHAPITEEPSGGRDS
jgi:hypothetical protein